jgi:hypothetical protein
LIGLLIVYRLQLGISGNIARYDLKIATSLFF